MTHCVIPGDVACASVEDGTVVLHMGTKRYYSLNETGAAIWRLIEANVAVEAIPSRLSESYDVPLDEARGAVGALIAELEAMSLITVGSP